MTYKGKPLVRKGNIIYYGNMADPFVIMISVADSHKVHGVDIADKVTVQLLNTDPNVNPKDAIAKKPKRKAFGRLWTSARFGLKERLPTPDKIPLKKNNGGRPKVLGLPSFLFLLFSAFKKLEQVGIIYFKHVVCAVIYFVL